MENLNLELSERNKKHLVLRTDRPDLKGIMYRFRFDNGYGASVVKHNYSCGGEGNRCSLSVLDEDGYLTYDTPFAKGDDNDVWVTDEKVNELLDKIQQLMYHHQEIF